MGVANSCQYMIAVKSLNPLREGRVEFLYCDPPSELNLVLNKTIFRALERCGAQYGYFVQEPVDYQNCGLTLQELQDMIGRMNCPLYLAWSLWCLLYNYDEEMRPTYDRLFVNYDEWESFMTQKLGNIHDYTLRMAVIQPMADCPLESFTNCFGEVSSCMLDFNFSNQEGCELSMAISLDPNNTDFLTNLLLMRKQLTHLSEAKPVFEGELNLDDMSDICSSFDGLALSSAGIVEELNL